MQRNDVIISIATINRIVQFIIHDRHELYKYLLEKKNDQDKDKIIIETNEIICAVTMNNSDICIFFIEIMIKKGIDSVWCTHLLILHYSS